MAEERLWARRFGHGISLAGEVGWLTILTIEEADGCEGVHTAGELFRTVG